jgi:diacylglycerol kinase (ATP)
MKSQIPMPPLSPASFSTKAFLGNGNSRSSTMTPVKGLTHPPQNKIPGRDLAWQIAPDLFTSFRYAWSGVRYAYVTQRNFRIHTVIGILAIAAGLSLSLSSVSLAILTLTSALVMVLELLNTALESVVDLTVGQSYHELAKIAKDCAAGAVLISAIAAVIVASCLLVPPLVALVF